MGSFISLRLKQPVPSGNHAVAEYADDIGLGLLAAAGSLTIVPGAFVIYFVRNYIAKGFALGRV